LNWFNRIFTILTLLVIIALAILVMVYPSETIASLDATMASLREMAWIGDVIRIAVAAVVIVVCLLVLLREFRRPQRSHVVVGKMEGATAELSVEAIAQRLRRDIAALGEVTKVDAAVTPKRGGVDVRLSVQTSADVDVPAKAAEVGRVARESLEQHMGLKVGNLRVNITHSLAAAGNGVPAIR